MSAQKARHFSRVIQALFLALTLTLFVATAQADDPTTPCDPNYMDAIEARAYLEAQREISQNQNLIVKPDSVLEYTCFDSFLNQVGDDDNWPNDGPFSDSDRWGDVPDQGNGALKDSLDQVVESTVSTYLDSNFDNNYLGGRASTHYQSPGDLDGGSYACSEMKTAWQDAQCMNFMNQQSRDGFYDFPWYSNNDPREYPDNSQACDVPDDFDQNIDTAFDNETDSYTLQTENAWPGAGDYYDSDPVVTHFDLIMPSGTSVGDGDGGTTTIDCTDVKPIPTGVCVVRASWSEVYGDAVCPNPGCHYVAPGDAANSTPSATDCSSGTPEIGTCATNAAAGDGD